MYKLVIVDDEANIRKGICDYINWQDMGFEVVASFEDGKETIEYLKEYDVDTVLTDIKMAEVSGLELSKYIYENMPHIKVVIISGYKEFEYARKAVEYGVEYYLLKPIKIDEVSRVFEKIKRNLDHIQEKENKSLEERKDFIKMLPELQEQFFVSLIVGGMSEEKSILKRMHMIDLDIDPKSPCILLDIKLNRKINNSEKQYKYSKEKRRNLINNIFREEREGIRYFPAHLSGHIIKVVAIASKKESQNLLLNKVEKCILEISTFLQSIVDEDFKIKISVEKEFLNIIDLSSHEILVQTHSLKQASQKFELMPEDYERLMQKYKLLIGIINDRDFEALDSLTENIYHEFRNIPLPQVQQMTIDMFSLLSSKFLKMGVDLWVYMKEKVDYQRILNTTTLEELKVLCKNTLQDTMKLLNSRKSTTSQAFVEQAVCYIKENFAKDISLEMIADKFFLNPAYFSRLFKQNTGSTFTDYLIKVRMEKAIKLLELGRYKVYEVSQRVGYKSEKYFFRIFRQYTGYSPTEYYRSMMIGGEISDEEL